MRAFVLVLLVLTPLAAATDPWPAAGAGSRAQADRYVANEFPAITVTDTPLSAGPFASPGGVTRVRIEAVDDHVGSVALNACIVPAGHRDHCNEPRLALASGVDALVLDVPGGIPEGALVRVDVETGATTGRVYATFS